MRLSSRLTFVLLAAAAAAGCDRPEPPSAEDTVARAEPQALAAPPAWTGEWSSGFGPILIVPSDADSTAILAYPESMPDAGSGIPVHLLSAGGDPMVRDVILSRLDSLECGGAPVVRLSAGAPGTWSVGLQASAQLLRGDSLETLPRGDSTRIVANLARLASTIGADQDTRFTGLPFTVVRARRYTIGNARLVAAHLVRRLPQEDSPLEEHTFLIGERLLATNEHALRFSDRSEGTEETAEHFEILAAVHRDGITMLLIARDNASGGRYEILERSATGTWRVRWARPLSC